MPALSLTDWSRRSFSTLRRAERNPRADRRRYPLIVRLEERTLLSLSTGYSFESINFNNALNPGAPTPPDTVMAVGPTTVVGAVNTSITLKDKAGNVLASPEQFRTFFSSIHQAGASFSDPYVLYDDQANRYYVGIIEFHLDGGGNPTDGFFDFAVSNSSSPTGLTAGSGAGQWTIFAQVSSVNEGGTEFPDFPKMGWNNQAVFVSFNQFSLSGLAFDHDLVLSIDKSSVLANTGSQGSAPTSYVQTQPTTSDTNIWIPSRMHGSSGNVEYFVQTLSESPTPQINVIAETGYLSGSPTFTSTAITVTPFDQSPGVPGLTNQIDDRMLSVAWIGNKLVAAQDVGVGGLNLARWYEIDTTSAPFTLLQQGDIAPGAGISTSYPSVAINAAGDIGVTFIQSSATQPYSMYVTGRLSGDPLNTMETPIEIAPGIAPVPNTLRGGDYSATEYDPVTPSVFWAANEFSSDNSGNNRHWGTHIVQFSPSTFTDLAVVKTAPPTVVSGANLTYTITVTNIAGSDAQNVSLTDLLPAGTVFVSESQSVGPAFACSTSLFAGSTLLTCTAPVLASGQSASFQVVVNAAARSFLPASLILNTANVSSTTTETNPDNNHSTAVTLVIPPPPTADLAVMKIAAPNPVAAGANLTYIIAESNAGPDSAANVVVTDVVPANTTFVSASVPAGWGVSAPPVGGTGSVIFTRASQASGASPVFTIVVKVNAGLASGSNISNTVTVASSTFDPNVANNSFTTNTPVNTRADLSVTKTIFPSPVTPGGSLFYTITVTNNGPSNAQTVVLTDPVPVNTQFVSFTQTSGPIFSAVKPAVGGTGVITATIPTLAAGASAAFTVFVNISPSATNGLVISNTAIVSSATTDPNPANNSTTVMVTVSTAGRPGAAPTIVTTSVLPLAVVTSSSVQPQAADLVLSDGAGLVADIIRNRNP